MITRFKSFYKRPVVKAKKAVIEPTTVTTIRPFGVYSNNGEFWESKKIPFQEFIVNWITS